MSDVIEQVGRALASEEGYAYDPLPYDARARAAIEAVRAYFENCAEMSKFYEDRHAYYVGAEELAGAIKARPGPD